MDTTVAVRPTRAELIARAEAMVPVLRARSAACEAAAAVPPETVAMFAAAGFYEILKPARYGGHEHSPKVLFDVCRVLARGCASSAWCLAVVLIHTWEVGVMGERAGDDIWGKDPATRISSSRRTSW